MIARIVDNHWIYLEQVSSDIGNLLNNEFSVRDPSYRFLNTDAWDGWYRKFDFNKNRLALPYLQRLIECCGKYNIPLQIMDGRPASTQPELGMIHEKMLAGITLEDYQLRAIRACCEHEIGQIACPTGGGKSEIFCALIKLFKLPTVVITEQLVVLEQIVQRLQLRGVARKEDIGIFCSGYLPDSDNPVIIGSIQSILAPSLPKRSDVVVTEDQALNKLLRMLEMENHELREILPSKIVDALNHNPAGIEKLRGSQFLYLVIEHFKNKEFERRYKWHQTRYQRAKEIQQMISKCEILIVDECDLASSIRYNGLCKKIYHGRRRWGFSGTPFDAAKPVQNLTLQGNLGSIIYEVPRKEVQEEGRIIPVKCYFIAIGDGSNRNDCRTYDIAMREEMVDNQKFHNLVAKINAGFPNEGNLILLDTTPIEPLGNALEKLIPNSKFIWCATSAEERQKYKEKFEKRELQCLIASRIFKRGLDLQGGVENLIIISSSKQWSNFNQMIGRAVRINKRGWARVIGFFNQNNKYLYRHSREALKAAVSLGYEVVVSIKGRRLDGAHFINNRFRIPS